ncbi:hypothetical protein AJ80_05497 [Polytolypa hystricis UAMH7299]|uniref:GTP-binding nuclear protein n=1 Tax=Polytolypa hystricis (strain UAMH7299) TaxID=1447883 RepID=A0A2B7Y2I6_POLH7|nr:hypothetical protein AJ80_05497 [Polytolypa hystricis UAMH7299]
MENPPPRIFKAVVVGDAGVGKTTLVKRFLYPELHFQAGHIATPGVEVHPLTFTTTHGIIHLDLWDTAGEEKDGSKLEKYYANADAAIIMFDVTNRISYKNVHSWYTCLKHAIGTDKPSKLIKIPVCLCVNKVDMKGRKVFSEITTYTQKKNLEYYEVSAKNTYCFDRPFLWLLRVLAGEPGLDFKFDAPTPVIAFRDTTLKSEEVSSHDSQPAAAASGPEPEDINSDSLAVETPNTQSEDQLRSDSFAADKKDSFLFRANN